MLDYRMTLLAGSGNIAVVRRRSPAFEHYLATYLGLGGLTVLEARGEDPAPVARQCREDPLLRSALEAHLVDAGGLTIQSYLTNGHDWRLAQALSGAAGTPVHVHGPAPRISKRANDKLWFWRQARRILGAGTVPPTFHAFGPAAAAAQVARIIASGRDAIVKIPSSAGGSGNFRLPAATLAGMDLAEMRALILGRLAASGWQGRYPILVGVWESGVVQSPSAQVFVPLAADGPPRLRGLFEQRVAGAEGKFTGAAPARLPDHARRAMRFGAIDLATVFQALGYFGWCSFDAILRDDGTLHWVECNARWSGVSIPFEAARRIGGKAPRGLAIVQEHMDQTGIGVEELVARLDDLLFRAGASREGIFLLSPPDAEMPLSFNAAAIAPSQSGAERLLTEGRARVG